MNRLIIFTRYPQPGYTKTRLIPALGAEGAAQLQQNMTEETVIKAHNLLGTVSNLSLEICYTGTDLSTMKNWLGDELIYQEQEEGDLGMKMFKGFQNAFQQGYQKVITIGIDCPDLSVNILATAFSQLDQAELVIGPATDGGYYLIGLHRLIPELFNEIHWGTDQVWLETAKIAETLQLNWVNLPILKDIDRPEDLY